MQATVDGVRTGTPLVHELAGPGAPGPALVGGEAAHLIEQYAGAVALVSDLAPVRERGRFQAVLAATMAVTLVAGPLLGRLIADQLSWRWIFYLNLPPGVLALAIIATYPGGAHGNARSRSPARCSPGSSRRPPLSRAPTKVMTGRLRGAA